MKEEFLFYCCVHPCFVYSPWRGRRCYIFFKLLLLHIKQSSLDSLYNKYWCNISQAQCRNQMRILSASYRSSGELAGRGRRSFGVEDFADHTHLFLAYLWNVF